MIVYAWVHPKRKIICKKITNDFNNSEYVFEAGNQKCIEKELKKLYH
jgi:hypothetical protein